MTPIPVTFRGKLVYIGLAYWAFVIYGSLVPLDYHSHDWDDAWQAFMNLPYLNLGIGSRADWVANILLYIPLSFLGSMLLIRKYRPLFVNLANAAVIFTACAITAVAIEFAQYYFPPRTQSLNDIIAEVIGSGLGIFAWFVWGARLSDLLKDLSLGGKKAIRAIVVLYVAGYLALSLFPYDFIDSFSELSWKLASEQYSLLVATAACDSGFRCMVKLVAEAAAVIPLGLLLAIESSRRPNSRLTRALLVGMLLGLVIEGLQFFLVSGISQGVSVLTRALGLAGGAALYSTIRDMKIASLRRWFRPAVLLSVPIYLIFLAALNRWFGEPWAGLAYATDQLGELHFLPFYYHYYTSEQKALFSLLAYTAMYIPTGFGYWAWTIGGLRVARRSGIWIAAFLGGSISLLIESGKLFIPGQHPDPTDVLIGSAAAASAYGLALLFTRWLTSSNRTALNHETVRPRLKQSVATDQAKPYWGMRILALLMALCIGGILLEYPLGRSWLALALVAYAALLVRAPSLWLVALPALLPVLDLAPWTGWFYLDEFDLFILTTLGVGLWQSADAEYPRVYFRTTRVLYGLLALSYAISLCIGLFPLQPLDANAFSSYYSHFNALRIAKGFVWAIALLPLLRRNTQEGKDIAAKFTLGMLLGLSGVIVATLWERHVFSGIANFVDNFRTTATFFTMHTGGGHIEAYLATALPFAAMWTIQARSLLPKLLGVVLFSGGVYAIMVTFSRGGYLALVVGIAVLLTGLMLRAKVKAKGHGFKAVTAILLLTAAGVTAIPILEGSYIQSRFKTSSADWDTRTAHWQDALRMMTPGWGTALFGMGLGRYPETYYWNNLEGIKPASFRYETERGNTYLRLSSGSPVNFEQIVHIFPGQTYTLSLDMRSNSPKAALAVPLCAKSLLYSFHCVSLNVQANSTSNTWSPYQLTFNSGSLGEGTWLSRQPVKLALYNAREGTLIDVDNIRLFDQRGNNLIVNGDFSKGNANWFFSTDNHLPWHIKNVWVALVFDQGWLGLIAFSMLLAYAVYMLFGRIGRGDIFAVTLLASITGFLAVGLFDSPFDASRLSMLFFTLMSLSVAGAPVPGRIEEIRP